MEMNTKIVQKCGCYEGDCVEILGLEVPLYACFTCGYAGVTPSGADDPHEDEVHVHDLLAEVKRLRKVILDFSLPMWNYLNARVHPDHEEFTANAVKSLVRNTPYESLMHLWEDACDYLPDPDCDDVPSNRPVWGRSDGE